jgi:hypothetical protein
MRDHLLGILFVYDDILDAFNHKSYLFYLGLNGANKLTNQYYEYNKLMDYIHWQVRDRIKRSCIIL